MNILKLKISELTKFVKDHIPAVIIALIIFGSVFGFLYKNMFKEYIVLMKEKNEFEKNKITQELNIKQKEKESQGLLEANLKKEMELLKLEMQLKDKQKSIDAEMQLNKYIDRYIAEFSDVDLNTEYSCDNEHMKRYRKAESILDAIAIKAKEAGKEKLYSDFISKKRSGIHAVIGCSPKLRKLDFNQEKK